MIGLEKKQKGITFISFMFILGLIAFFALLGFKVGPIYLNHSKVMDAMMAVKETDGIERTSRRDVKLSLSKRLDMNYADVDIENFKVIKRVNFVSVDLNYKKVEKIIGNLSVVAEFHESFEVGEEL
jgi:hypothetical protein